jgi:ribosome-associated heat shock protein Hsp15
MAAGVRRGPAPEAQELYDDLSPTVSVELGAPVSEKGGRPTKKDRRKLDQSRFPPLE